MEVTQPKYCVNSDGVLTYALTSQGNTVTLTSYSPTVTDSDLSMPDENSISIGPAAGR